MLLIWIIILEKTIIKLNSLILNDLKWVWNIYDFELNFELWFKWFENTVIKIERLFILWLETLGFIIEI